MYLCKRTIGLFVITSTNQRFSPIVLVVQELVVMIVKDTRERFILYEILNGVAREEATVRRFDPPCQVASKSASPYFSCMSILDTLHNSRQTQLTVSTFYNEQELSSADTCQARQ